MGLCAYYANPRNKRIAKQAWIEIMQTGTDEVTSPRTKAPGLLRFLFRQIVVPI